MNLDTPEMCTIGSLVHVLVQVLDHAHPRTYFDVDVALELHQQTLVVWHDVLASHLEVYPLHTAVFLYLLASDGSCTAGDISSPVRHQTVVADHCLVHVLLREVVLTDLPTRQLDVLHAP